MKSYMAGVDKALTTIDTTTIDIMSRNKNYFFRFHEIKTSKNIVFWMKKL